MSEITLEDTIKMMRGDCWQDRFRAEYWQVKIRAKRLGTMLDRLADEGPDFEPNCPFYILAYQFRIMANYVGVLEKRAKIEGIDLDRRVDE